MLFPLVPFFPPPQLMDENILFFLEVSSLKSAGGGQTQYLRHVKRIYNLYIRPASPREVNISGDIHIATSAAVHAVLNAPRLDVDGGSCDSDTSTLVKVGTDEESPNAAKDCEPSAKEEEGEGVGVGGREEEGEGVQTVVDCLEALRSVRAEIVGAGGRSLGGRKVGESGLGGTGGRAGGVASAAAAAVAAARASRAAKRRPNSQKLAARGRPLLETHPLPDGGGDLPRQHSRWMSLPGVSPLSLDARLLTAPPTAESLAGERADDSGANATPRNLEDSICFQGTSKLLPGAALAPGRGTREPSPAAAAVTSGGVDEEESGDSRAVEGRPEQRETRSEREAGGGSLSVRRCRDRVNSTWVSDPDDANLGSQGGLGLDANGEIERLRPGGGPGGGFGDRSIFDSAQNEIYDILRTEVYPKFAADVFARNREGSPTPATQDVNSAKSRASATSKVKVLMKAMMSMRSG